MPEAGPFFASAGDDIKIWDSLSAEVVKQYNFHKGSVKDLSWSHDNAFLCSTSSSGDKILLCDCQLLSKDKPKIVAEHASGEHQTCVKTSPGERKLYSGGVEGATMIWDRYSGKLKKFYKDTHSSPVTCIALNDSETHLASGSSKGDVVIRNLSSDVITKPTLNTNGSAVRAMTFSPWKNSLLGMTLDDGSLNLWDALHGRSYHNFQEIHNAPAMALAFSTHNDLLLASVGLDKYLMIYDVKSHKFLNKTLADHPLTSLAFMHNGVSLFAGSSMGKIYHFDLRSLSRPVKHFVAHSTSVHRITVQNLIKLKRERSRTVKTEDRVTDRRTAVMEGVTERNRNPKTIEKLEGGRSTTPSVTTSMTNNSRHISSSASFSMPDSSKVTNGTHRLKDTKAKLKEEGSSSSLKFTKVLPSQVDDLGGVLSPVREDVFENLSATSADANLSTFPLDPTLMGVTLSSSTDTIGSYCDDILSPVTNNARLSKNRTPLGTQIHSRTSPHPLRESHNFVPGAGGDKADNLAPFHKGTGLDDGNGTCSSTTTPLAGSNTSTPIERNAPPVIISGSQQKNKQTMVTQPLVQKSKSETDEPLPNETVSTVTSTISQAATSTSNLVTLAPTGVIKTSAGEVPVFQYQAEYLRNTVKEMVDDLGDQLRSQMNEHLAQMVKFFLRQEEVIQAQRCDVNQRLLQEVERLKEENERLRRRSRDV
ncbi:uncharacterized protein LOC143459780 isoform X1 [Clavelina lepadiformis]|uniref:uncharacterized protein LOC143459780 isoform X1 n=1 Tax=Clavelina lepadiformis TaxID=159417 RepID=UPI0040426CD4